MSVNNLSEIADLVALLVMLRECFSSLTIGLGSTCTYGGADSCGDDNCVAG